VQEACSIIQNAADENANIIFGAVLDEKMKDAVKITVIATGFKEEDRPRRKTETTGFVVNSADDFDSIPEPPPMVMEEAHPAPTAAAGAGAVSMASSSADGIALDSMRNAMIANFEQADLDVPAFLRKRNDTI